MCVQLPDSRLCVFCARNIVLSQRIDDSCINELMCIRKERKRGGVTRLKAALGIALLSASCTASLLAVLLLAIKSILGGKPKNPANTASIARTRSNEGQTDTHLVTPAAALRKRAQRIFKHMQVRTLNDGDRLIGSLSVLQLVRLGKVSKDGTTGVCENVQI